MDLQALKAEITTDPEGIGYAGKNDEQTADLLNAQTRQPNRESMTGGMLAASIVRAELAAIPNADQNYIRALLPCGEMPLTVTLKNELRNIFAAGTTTRANLIALLQRPGSRADELGIGFVTPSNVADARRL